MGELTLDALKKRVEALEIALGMKTPNNSPKYCQNVAHMFGESELMNGVDEDCHRMRESECKLKIGNDAR